MSSDRSSHFSRNLLKNLGDCHLERSEGSAVCRQPAKTADSSLLSTEHQRNVLLKKVLITQPFRNFVELEKESPPPLQAPPVSRLFLLAGISNGPELARRRNPAFRPGC